MEDDTHSHASGFAAIYSSFDLFMPGLVLPFLVFSGWMGATLVLWVFRSSELWHRLRWYLIALALWDVALLSGAFCLFSLPIWFGYFCHDCYQRFIFSYPYTYCLNNMAMTGRIWSTVALTVERYLAICHPMRHVTWSRDSEKSKWYLLGLSVSAVIISIPRAFEVDFTTDEYNVTVANRSSLLENQLYFNLYHVLGGVMLIFLGPLMVILYLTLEMVNTIRLSFKSTVPAKRSSLSDSGLRNRSSASPMSLSMHCHSEKHGIIKTECTGRCRRPALKPEAKMTAANSTLIIVPVMSLVCYTLPTIIDVLESVCADEIINSNAFTHAVQVSNTLVAFNSASTFYLYCLCGSRFRAQLKSRCKSFVRWCSDASPTSSQNDRYDMRTSVISTPCSCSAPAGGASSSARAGRIEKRLKLSRVTGRGVMDGVETLPLRIRLRTL